MHIVKQLTALILSAALCLTLLAGCAREPDGVSLSVCVGDIPETLDPIYAGEIGDQTILAHLYENLMRVTVDASGTPIVTNGMAKSVEQEESYDGTVTYTFRLRSAKWSDGVNVKAGDFVYAWRRLAHPASRSSYAALLSVVAGYEEARAAGDMELLQISAKNDNTLVVVLSGHYDWFLTEVCTSPATVPLREDVVQKLKEAADEKTRQTEGQKLRWWFDPTALVVNGPYQVSLYEEGAALTAAANERYYSNQAGPKTLTFHFAATAEEAWSLYEHRTVDAVWPLPESQLAELAAEEGWTPLPELETYAALFNCGQEMLADPLVRKAFYLSIDRAALAEAAGITARPAEGLVPFGVQENGEGSFRDVGGALLDNDPEVYEENRIRAKAFLAEAGYDSGVSLGALEYLYIDEGTNGAVAQAICQMWREVLGVVITPVPLGDWELWNALQTGDYDLAGAALTAVGSDAECFLMNWTSGSPDNVVRYTNSAYDTLMSIIASAANGTARMGCLHDAESLLISDCVVAPLYNKGTSWELRETLTGACRDARGWFSFSNVVTRIA